MWENYMLALAFVGLIDAVSYMVVTPSIVFYVEEVGGSASTYGLVLSIFSFASFTVKPFLGTWSDMVGFRIPYFLGLWASCLGGAFYFLASHYDSIAMIFIGRALGGFGAATSALGFAYVAKIVPHEENTKVSSILSMVRILGMAAGPGVNFFLADVNFEVLGFSVDEYNSVGLVLVVSNFLALASIFFLLQEPTEEQLSAHEESLHRPVHTEKASMGLLVRSFFNIEILVPILSIFTFNANFQLIETAFTPAANHALGWTTVQCSLVLGSLAVLIFAVMMLVYALSARQWADEHLLTIGLVLGGVGYFLVWDLWVWESTTWNFIIPILVATCSFPFLAAPTRAIFTKAVDDIPAMDGHQGTMQAILSMFASAAGFIAPSIIASFILRSPDEVESSSDGRELTMLALFAPILSIVVLLGVIVIDIKHKTFGKPLEPVEEGEATEETALVQKRISVCKRASQSTTPDGMKKYDHKVELHRRSSVAMMGVVAPEFTKRLDYDDNEGPN